MTRRFFSGSTLEQAVMLAARHHGVDPEELEYRKVEKKHGFLRGRRAVMIAVDPERPRREPGAAPSGEPEAAAVPPAEATPPEPPPRPEPEPLRREEPPAEASGPEERQPEAGPPPATPARPPAGDEMLDAARRGTELLMRFAGIQAEAEARPGEERVEVEIEGADADVLLVEGGRGLLAIQHLLPRVLRGYTGQTSFVRVDSGGFHENRKQRLQALARREAETARKQGRSRTLAPMAPDERRIVHMALAEDPGVVTQSRGAGLRKRIVILPADEAGDGGGEHFSR